jgi:hypothetical protein
LNPLPDNNLPNPQSCQQTRHRPVGRLRLMVEVRNSTQPAYPPIRGVDFRDSVQLGDGGMDRSSTARVEHTDQFGLCAPAQ